MIYITCPDCTADTPMQARAMLATLDLVRCPRTFAGLVTRRAASVGMR
jgi:hypothetical protein